MRIHKLMLHCFLVLFITSVVPSLAGNDKRKKPKTNVILLIGDGMGLSQVSTLYYYHSQEPNHFNRFRNIGLMKTSSASHKITDSAAGATAFSSGQKTYNGAIGVDTDTVSIPTLFEIIPEYRKGLVATSSIVHATPAAFYAHVKHRSEYENIASQLVTTNIHFFAGGGLKFFNKRSDQLDLVSSFEVKGMQMDTSGLNAGKLDKNKSYGFLLSADGMPKANEGRWDFLPNATGLAINHLSSSREAFFLMVEGSQIDWAGHANDKDYLISEMLDFNKALGVALDFADNNPNTLVLVTADHETGGFTLAGKKNNYNELKPSFSTTGHSATLIPVFAYGKDADKFGGIYENIAINEKILSVLGIEKELSE